MMTLKLHFTLLTALRIHTTRSDNQHTFWAARNLPIHESDLFFFYIARNARMANTAAAAAAATLLLVIAARTRFVPS